MVTTRQISKTVIAPWQFDAASYIANNWYLGALPGTNGVAGVVGSNIIQYMAPFIVRQTITIGALGIRTSTPGSSNIQLAIYANDTSPINRPGALLGNTGNIANNGTAGFYSDSLRSGGNPTTVQLTPGIYWLALQCNDATCIVMAATASGGNFAVWMGSSAGTNVVGSLNAQAIGLSVASTFGTWAPSLNGASFTELTNLHVALIAFQVASVP